MQQNTFFSFVVSRYFRPVHCVENIANRATEYVLDVLGIRCCIQSIAMDNAS